MRAAAALAFAVALTMRAAGRGGSEDEVEEVDEAEDKEEVVDPGWAVMRAGLWAAVSAAATAGRMEGMSSGCRLGGGGWGGPVVTWQPGGPIFQRINQRGSYGRVVLDIAQIIVGEPQKPRSSGALSGFVHRSSANIFLGAGRCEPFSNTWPQTSTERTKKWVLLSEATNSSLRSLGR